MLPSPQLLAKWHGYPARSCRTPQRASLGHAEPGEGGNDGSHDAVDQERGFQAETLGQESARKRPDSHGEQEHALVDGQRASAGSRRGDVGKHDEPGRQHDSGPCPGDQAREQQFNVGSGGGAPQVAEYGHGATER